VATTPLLLHALQNNAGQPLVSFPYTVADSLGAEATAQKQRRCVAIVPRSRFDANRSFAQTGSNKGKRKRRFVCTGTAGNELNFHSWFDPTGAKRHFLCHSYIKCIILPRQARDKHRESTQKRVAFRIVVVPHAPAGGVGTGFANPGGQVRKRISMRHVYAQNDQSAKTGSGQT
jgi:hypothetical protein